MTHKEIGILIGEMIGEAFIGGAIGTAVSKLLPTCNKGEKLIVVLGSALAAWTVGRTWGRETLRLADEYLDTDMYKYID